MIVRSSVALRPSANASAILSRWSFMAPADAPARSVTSAPASTTGDLMEITGSECGHFFATVFAQAREQNGADGHVDADAESVGAADHFQKAVLREFFHQHTVAWQQTSVMDADAMTEILPHLLPVGARELRASEQLFN